MSKKKQAKKQAKKKQASKKATKSVKVPRTSFEDFVSKVYNALTKTAQTSNEIGCKLGLADKKGNVAAHRLAKLRKALGTLIAAGQVENVGAYKTSAYRRT